MQILQKLQQLLSEQPKDFFPKSLRLPAVRPVGAPPIGRFPLLDLLNDTSTAAPKLPLTIPALESLLPTIGKDELARLHEQFLNAIHGDDPIDVLEQIFGALNDLAKQAVNLIGNQLIIGASLVTIVNALR